MLSMKQARFLANTLKVLKKSPATIRRLALHPNTIGTGIAIDISQAAFKKHEREKERKRLIKYRQ